MRSDHHRNGCIVSAWDAAVTSIRVRNVLVKNGIRGRTVKGNAVPLIGAARLRIVPGIFRHYIPATGDIRRVRTVRARDRMRCVSIASINGVRYLSPVKSPVKNRRKGV